MAFIADAGELVTNTREPTRRREEEREREGKVRGEELFCNDDERLELSVK